VEQTDLAPGQIVSERYRIIQKLGQGGMGVVYQAEQIFLKRHYALKMLRKGMVTETAWRRFQKEAKMASLLDHPGLVKVQDFGFIDQSEEEPFFAMDYVEGLTLQDILRRGPLAPNLVLVIFQQLSAALAHAHARNVIHRDIKPSNIIVAGTPDDESSIVVKILDFGIAKVATGEDAESIALTRTGEIFGTPYYMSPEQCMGLACDDRSDMYGVGCVMYEALTGVPPCVGDTALQTMMRHQTDKPLSLKEATLGRTFPPGMEEVVARLLEKDPRARYSSLFDLHDDLKRIKSGEKILAAGESVSVEAAAADRDRWKRRSYTLAVLASIVVCSIGAFFVGRFIAPEPPAKESKPPERQPRELAADSADALFSANEDASGGYFSAPVKGTNLRVFHFPEKPIGRIKLCGDAKLLRYDCKSASYVKPNPPDASGELLVQDFTPLGIDTGFRDISILERFRPDDLSYLNIAYHSLQKGSNPMNHIVHLTSLNYLNMEQNKGALDDSAIDQINQLPNLTQLFVKATGITPTGVARLKRLRQLSALSMSGPDGTQVLEKMTGSQAANILLLESCGLGSRALEIIGTMPNLNRLELSTNDQINDEDIKHLLALKKLRWLEVRNCSRITPQALAQLGGLPLTELVLSDRQYGDRTDAAVRYLQGVYGQGVVQTIDNAAPQLKKVVREMP
jgi:serine/threonine-protein kinase